MANQSQATAPYLLSGQPPQPTIAGVLRDVRYDGPVVIEAFTPKVREIARAVSISRPLAKTKTLSRGPVSIIWASSLAIERRKCKPGGRALPVAL
jgi:hypothetical protein